MTELKVKVAAPEVGRQLEVPFEVGSDLDENANKFGADVVNKVFIRQAIIAYQAFLRGQLKKKTETGEPLTDEQIIAVGANWKLGVITRTGMSKPDKARKLLSQLSKEEIEALLEEYVA